MEELRFDEGQLLSYGTSGICVVDEIKFMSIASGVKPENYYILRQLRNDESRIFVPVNNERLTHKMRRLLTCEEIEKMICEVGEEHYEWVADRRIRNEMFHAILVEGVSLNLIRMIVCIYERIDTLKELGKKLPVTDSNTLKSAERLVAEEFGYVLGVEAKELGAYFENKLHLTAV